jgi:sialic acid synthase SpsE
LFGKIKGEKEAIYNRSDRCQVSEFRRGLYFARDLKRGEAVKEEDLLFCRPTSQLSPNDLEWLLGKFLTRDVCAYEPIVKEVISRHPGE